MRWKSGYHPFGLGRENGPDFVSAADENKYLKAKLRDIIKDRKIETKFADKNLALRKEIASRNK